MQTTRVLSLKGTTTGAHRIICHAILHKCVSEGVFKWSYMRTAHGISRSQCWTVRM